MASEVRLSTRGKKGFTAASRRYERRVKNKIRLIIQECAEMIQDVSSVDVPIDTGQLQDSITITYYNGGLSAEIIVNEFYGIYVEYGTGIYARDGDGRKTPWTYYNERIGQWVTTQGHEPQPFFEPAVRRAARHFVLSLNRL